MLLKYFISILLIGSSVFCYSQDTIIEFDRPGAADLPYLVPQKTLQIEVGYGLSVDDSAGFGFDSSPSFYFGFLQVKFLN